MSAYITRCKSSVARLAAIHAGMKDSNTSDFHWMKLCEAKVRLARAEMSALPGDVRLVDYDRAIAKLEAVEEELRIATNRYNR